MVAYSQLILPILLSGVLVFVVSSIMHTVLTYHHSDFKKLGNEDEVRAAVRKGNATAGMYMIPYCSGHKEMKSPENMKKLDEGPPGMLVLRPTGQIHMASFSRQWRHYTLSLS